MPSNRNEQLFTAQSIAASANGEPLDVSACARGSVAVVWAGPTQNNSVLKLQESMDKTTWFDIATATATMDGTLSKKLVVPVDMPWLRAVITRTTETTGTVTARVFMKADY